MRTERRCWFGFPFTGSGSLLIGLIQILWASIPWVENGRKNSLFVAVLRETGTSEVWLAIMMLSGFLLCVSSVMLVRSLRHIALFLSCMVMISSFSAFVLVDVVTPVSVTLPLLGAYALLLLVVDSSMKTKRKEKRKG